MKKIEDSGFNFIMIYFYEERSSPQNFENTLLTIANKVGKHSLFLLPSTNFTDLQTPVDYSHFVDAGGRVMKGVPCPCDKRYWQKAVKEKMLTAARLSINYPLIKGYGIDFEMYGRDFTLYTSPCYCQRCFHEFLQKYHLPERFKKLSKEKRFKWLQRKGLIEKYREFQTEKVAKIVEEIEKDVHKINPNFVLAIYPYYFGLENFFDRGIIRGWTKKGKVPLLIFSEKEYTSGYTENSKKRMVLLKKEKFNTKYIPGLWVKKHPPNQISNQCFQCAKNTDGYWIYPVIPVSGKSEEIYKGSTCEEYWNAFTLANREIERFIKSKGKYKDTLKINAVFYSKRVKPIMKIFRVENPPKIDGKLNDFCWKNVYPLSGFLDRSKDGLLSQNGEGLAKTSTLAYLGYDDNNLYVAFKCYEPSIKKLKLVSFAHDAPIWDHECVEVFLYPDPAQDVYYHFITDAIGNKCDELCRGDVGDLEWNCRWKSQGGIDVNNKFWTVELAIPWLSLGRDVPNPKEVWGINLCRERHISPSELSSWSHYERGLGFHSPSQFGEAIFSDKLEAEDNLPLVTVLSIGQLISGKNVFQFKLKNTSDILQSYRACLYITSKDEKRISKSECVDIKIDKKKVKNVKIDYEIRNPGAYKLTFSLVDERKREVFWISYKISVPKEKK
ncbi:hypothetical protein J7K25_03065 [bacterium]|nr:hypothetical protein [bacterium]